MFSSSPFGQSSASNQNESSTPAFGFSISGQTPAFGGSGSSPNQFNAFANSTQQTQSIFGANTFGPSAPFSGTNPTALGDGTAMAFSGTSTPNFGVTGNPFSGTSTPNFGVSSNPFIGTSTPAFGVSSNPSSGTSTPAFGLTISPAFGPSSPPAFGVTSNPFSGTSTPAFGDTSNPAFGPSSPPTFSNNSIAFGVSAPSFGSGGATGASTSHQASTFGSTPTFGPSNSTGGGSSVLGTGSLTTKPTFGNTAFGQPPSNNGLRRRGSRIVAYTSTPEEFGSYNTQIGGKIVSISGMTAYKDRSHEELRWEDLQNWDKGGPSPAGQFAGGIGISASTTQSNPLFSSTTSNPFAPEPTGGFGFGTSFNPVNPSTNSNPFGPRTQPFSTYQPSQSVQTVADFPYSMCQPPAGFSTFGQPPAFGGFGSNLGQFNEFAYSIIRLALLGFQTIGQPPAGTSPTSAFGAPTANGTSSGSPAFGGVTSSVFGTASGQLPGPFFPFGHTANQNGNPTFGPSATPAFGNSGFSTIGQPFGSIGSSPNTLSIEQYRGFLVQLLGHILQLLLHSGLPL